MPSTSWSSAPIALATAAVLAPLTGAQSALYTRYGEEGDRFGYSVSSAGDVNRDGRDDLIVGAPMNDEVGRRAGSAHVYSGSGGSLLFDFYGKAHTELGHSVSGAGDVNGDGWDDVIVGAPRTVYSGTERAYVFSGRDGTVLWSWTGWVEWFGHSVSGAGDVNGDGHADVIVGAPGTDFFTWQSYARVFSGLDGSVLHSFHELAAADRFGYSVSGSGDLDGDGFADLIVGAPQADGIGADSGCARVFSGIDGAHLFSLEGDSAGDLFGHSVGGEADFNGDGQPDLVAGALGDDNNGSESGSARLFSGVPLRPVRYCTAKANSLGCLPSIGHSGLPSTTGADDYFVTAVDVLSNKPGLMTWGRAPHNLPFLGGILCVAPPLVRTPAQDSGGNPPPSDCSGAYAFHLSQAYMAGQSISAGDQLYAQYWSRDPGLAPPHDVGLTDGLGFLVMP